MTILFPSILEDASRRLCAEFSPEEIWLFGSQAWGQPDADSDVDLLVIVPHSNESPVRRAQRAHRSLIGLPMAKDVLVKTRAEVERFRHAPSSLTHKILSEGRRVYG